MEESLEDFVVSRSERRELKACIAELQGDLNGVARVRQMAFKLAAKTMEEFPGNMAMDWLQAVIQLLYARENTVKSSAYFSPEGHCLSRIRQFIGEAKVSLEICVFTITDNRIVEKIEEAAARKVRIRVISDDDKSEDIGSDLDRMGQMGIACVFDKTPAHMHHKFAIADGDLLLTGSYNWTRSAAEENNENLIVTNDRKLVLTFQEEFNRLWRSLRDA